MTKDKYYDILVVGAGPAGCVASLYAQKHGLSVLLIDKNQFPRDKVCGDAFMPICFDILNDLGIYFDNFHDLFVDINVANIYSNNLHVTVPTNIKNVKRIVFDKNLNDFTKSKIEFLENTELEKNSSDEVFKYASLKNSFGNTTIKYKYLIGADGSSSFVRRLFNFPKPTEYAVASRSYLEVRNNKPLFFLRYIKETIPGYFWGFSVSEKQINTGVILFDTLKQNNIKSIHYKLVSEYFNIKNFETHVWQIPFNFDVEKTVNDDVFLIGDAGGFIDPILGHGIDTAMYSAKICIESIINNQNDPQSFYVKEINRCINYQRRDNLKFRNSLTKEFLKGDTAFINYYLEYLKKGKLEYHLK